MFHIMQVFELNKKTIAQPVSSNVTINPWKYFEMELIIKTEHSDMYVYLYQDRYMFVSSNQQVTNKCSDEGTKTTDRFCSAMDTV